MQRFKLFHILWKGTSANCHSNLNDYPCVYINKAIVDDHAACMIHTHETFE